MLGSYGRKDLKDIPKYIGLTNNPATYRQLHIIMADVKYCIREFTPTQN